MFYKIPVTPLSKWTIHTFAPFYSAPLSRHPREPLTPFHFAGESRVCHVFPPALICMHQVFPNILSPYATRAKRTESENTRYRERREIPLFCSMNLIFRRGSFLEQNPISLFSFSESCGSQEVRWKSRIEILKLIDSSIHPSLLFLIGKSSDLKIRSLGKMEKKFSGVYIVARGFLKDRNFPPDEQSPRRRKVWLTTQPRASINIISR